MLQKDGDEIFIENASYLGNNPTCDVCGKYINEGDEIYQSFTGRTIMDHREDELVIDTVTYVIQHVNCKK